MIESELQQVATVFREFHLVQNRMENCHQHLLSERLTSLGIMGAPRVPPLNPSETIVLCDDVTDTIANQKNRDVTRSIPKK